MKNMQFISKTKLFSFFLLFSISHAQIELGSHSNLFLASENSVFSFSQFEGNDPKNTFQTAITQADTNQTAKPSHLSIRNEQGANNLEPSESVIPGSSSGEGPVINFNNVNIVEFLRFVSRLTGKNFVFDPDELQFPITIISESPASVEDIMAALLQNLKMHKFLVVEEGNNVIIYTNTEVVAPGGLLKKDLNGNWVPDIATQVFQLYNSSAERVTAIIKTMVSKDAVVEVVLDTQRVVVTDLTSNIVKINEIVKKIDAPNSGLEIGQYVAINNSPGTLILIAQPIIEPIAAEKTLVIVPYPASNSVFIVSTPFVVEKSLSILQAIDLNQQFSGMMSLDSLKFDSEKAASLKAKQQQGAKSRTGRVPFSQDELDSLTDKELTDILNAMGIDPAILQKFLKDPKRWRDEINKLIRESQVNEHQQEQLASLRQRLFASELPVGTVESTQFYIHKLAFRNADDVANALQSIATSLMGGTTSSNASPDQRLTSQSDLVTTLNSVQVLEQNNALVITGTRASINKIKELISQIDVPVRQVFIEALILDTTITNALNFGTEWAGKVQSDSFAYQTGLVTANSSLAQAFNLVQMPPLPTLPPTTIQPVPLNEGFTADSISRKIKFNGRGFRATGALISALRHDETLKVIMNPKITVEHNVPAEIFVGEKTPIKGQSIANATGTSGSSIVATNFETRETGVLLKVTPLISSNEIVTLIIEQKISAANQTQVANQGNPNAPPATTSEIRTITRVHLPSDYFLIMSGLIRNDDDRITDMIPCLGALPLAGFFFSTKQNNDVKRNIILMIRPKIIDTPIDIERITETEDKLFHEHNVNNTGIRRELNDLRDLLNLKILLGEPTP